MPTQRHYPKRPPRLDHVYLRPFYFVTFNTHRRIPLLPEPEVHETFRRFCFRAHREHDIAVGRYVIMPDHVHLFAALPECGLSLKEWLRTLKTTIGKELLRFGKQKPHWQDGFFDHLLRSDESYAHKWEYVQRNPVRAGLCETPGQWPYQGEIVIIPYS